MRRVGISLERSSSLLTVGFWAITSSFSTHRSITSPLPISKSGFSSVATSIRASVLGHLVPFRWESENSRILIVYSSLRGKWDSVIMFPGLATSPHFIQILFDGFGNSTSGNRIVWRTTEIQNCLALMRITGEAAYRSRCNLCTRRQGAWNACRCRTRSPRFL